MRMVFLLLLFSLTDLLAEDAVQPAPKKWTATAESGVVISTGNTENKTISLKTYAKYEPEKWLYELKLEKLFGSTSGQAKADIFTAYQKSAYKMSGRDLIFESIKYNKDRFNGFNYEFNTTLGYERKIIDNSSVKLGIAAGPSYYRFAKVEVTFNKLTATTNIPFLWNIREDLIFSQNLNFVFGDSSVGLITESISGLQVKLIGNLAMKNTLTVKNKTKAPEGKKNTDTITEVTLVMDF
jgi:putative salt-induced outer membrane protein